MMMQKRHELVSKRTLGIINDKIIQKPGITSKELASEVGMSDRTVRAATKQLLLHGRILKRISLNDLRHCHFYSAEFASSGTVSLRGAIGS